MLNLDTHILVFALSGALEPAERNLVATNQWSVSAIVLWELDQLAKRGRIAIDLESTEFRRVFSRVHIWPLDWAVSRQASQLDFKSDPADELIAATSIVHRVPLLTRDRKIHRSALVPFAGLRN